MSILYNNSNERYIGYAKTLGTQIGIPHTVSLFIKIQQNYMTEAAKNEKTNIQHTACDMHDYVYCAYNGKCHEDLH